MEKDKNLRIAAKPEIRMIAQMEAMKSYKLIKEKGTHVEKRVFAYPEILTDRQDLFDFGVVYGQTLTELSNGLTDIPLDLEEHFRHIENHSPDL